MSGVEGSGRVEEGFVKREVGSAWSGLREEVGLVGVDFVMGTVKRKGREVSMKVWERARLGGGSAKGGGGGGR